MCGSTPVEGAAAGTRLMEIAKAESVAYENGVIDALLEYSEGDLRRAITYMQSAARLVGAGAVTAPGKTKKRPAKVVSDEDDEDEEMPDADGATSGNKVTVQIVEEISGVVPSATIDHLIAALQPGRFPVYNQLQRVVTDIVADGWSANQVLLQLFQRIVLQDDTVEPSKKNQFVAVFSEMDRRLIDGAEEMLTILDLSLRVAAILAQR